MKRNALTVVIGAVLVLIFALLLFVFQVRQSETAVVATFGKPVATYTNAGAYFKWPWPVQKVYKYDQRCADDDGESVSFHGIYSFGTFNFSMSAAIVSSRL